MRYVVLYLYRSQLIFYRLTASLKSRGFAAPPLAHTLVLPSYLTSMPTMVHVHLLVSRVMCLSWIQRIQIVLLQVVLFLFTQGMGGKVGDPVGPRSLAAPHRPRSLLPLGVRWESWLMGRCGPAQPWSPPRSHTFPYPHLMALRGVLLYAVRRVHRCMRYFASTTLLPIPLRPLLRLRLPHHPCCMCMVVRRLVLQ